MKATKKNRSKIDYSKLPVFVLTVTIGTNEPVKTGWDNLMTNCAVKGWDIGNQISTEPNTYEITKNGKVIGSFTEEIIKSSK